MSSLKKFVNNRLMLGRAYFTREEVQEALGYPNRLTSAAIRRQIQKNQLVSPRQGFYLIVRPEEQTMGPDPNRWIDPLMRFLQVDYRISLLRAAAFHGASHQAAMTFQVITPRQLQPIVIGRNRVEFIYQSPLAFKNTNQPSWLSSIKSDAGYAQVAGIEQTLLDCIRYFHKTGGINNVAQIVKDLGGQASPKQLAKIAVNYENSCVRRLGYLLELTGHQRQAHALSKFVKKAKNISPLDPSIQILDSSLDNEIPKSADWLLTINEPIEVDF